MPQKESTMSTNLKVSFTLSEEFRQRRFVADGVLPEMNQTLELDMSTATPKQRQAIAAYCGVRLEVEIGVWKNYTVCSEPTPHLDKVALDVIPDLDMVVANVRRMAAEKQAAQEYYDADRRTKCETDLAKKIQTLRNYLAERKIGGDYDTTLWRYGLAEDGKRLRIDRSDYDALRVEYDAQVAIRKAEIKAEHEANEERKRIEAEQAEQARLAWIQANGSEHLQRAIAAGHDCNRRYLVERAAQEYPGYVLDYGDAAAWKSRSCPSIEALNERDAILAAHPGATVEIVWLTAEPRDHKREEEDYYAEPDEEREAVVVSDSEIYGGRWLVK
ncbi:hypothetical protein KKF45_05570 [Patescibacteria group bacterium]|nr:hypothetical protein [Patescibacteria group bacterium]